MRHRVGSLVGAVAEKMWVSTFHSACVRILRRDAAKLASRRASRSAASPTQAFVALLIRDLGHVEEFPRKSFANAIASMAKEN